MVQYLISTFIDYPSTIVLAHRNHVRCIESRPRAMDERTMHPADRRKNLERLLEKTPNDSFLLYARAMTFVAEGNENEGLFNLTALLEAHPDYHAAHLQIGQLLAARGETDQ